eukprot:CAMPEP_0202116866 /NCGR_PEP_ID=MMETSP0965-20130614/41585_1 /ASSEMBLY_ACC=CAM_ASM_000507 /TAXON_ID=4773 /ORGANISM="Schizochytrium aggregatum, Strain ATCC28209" /LENGTH=52 /DNA_ID=CAMNT_0048686747 /DNA_START=19 /DNA_END=173 /DNA_ORIENTATION=-
MMQPAAVIVGAGLADRFAGGSLDVVPLRAVLLDPGDEEDVIIQAQADDHREN